MYGRRVPKLPRPREPGFDSFEYHLSRAGRSCISCYDARDNPELGLNRTALPHLKSALDRTEDPDLVGGVKSLDSDCIGCNKKDPYVANGITNILEMLRAKQDKKS